MENVFLYIIPTPIAENGLHCLPEQVKEIARNLDVFIVERAKTARHFIKSLGLSRPIAEMTFVEIGEKDHSEAEAAFLQAVAQNKSVGLLSEAGCPAVADPGAIIVSLAHKQGVRVVPLVGPSSILLALMASGMNGQRFVFHGYLPPNRPELARELRRLEQMSSREDQTQIFIETPYRSQMVLEVALESLGADTRFCFAQDLSGASEQLLSMKISDWKKRKLTPLGKLPTVFLLYLAKRK